MNLPLSAYPLQLLLPHGLEINELRQSDWHPRRTILHPERIHQCPQCGRSYNALRNLKYHMKHICGQPPKHVCDYCDHRFYQKSKLLLHVANCHRNNLKDIENVIN